MNISGEYRNCNFCNEYALFHPIAGCAGCNALRAAKSTQRVSEPEPRRAIKVWFYPDELGGYINYNNKKWRPE